MPRPLTALALVALALFAIVAPLWSAHADPPAPSSTPPPTPVPAHCNPQSAQPFLIRGNYLRGPHRHEALERTIRYRTEHYGYFTGFGSPAWNAHTPRDLAVTTTFMGQHVVMNRDVVPALACVEHEIRHACTAHPYQPHALAGIRFQNTYHTGEITNHAYGIAIDIDPTHNTCCHCVGHWAEHPLCRNLSGPIWSRMVMPSCWVDAFERYGFYWLGHDTLQDTMHFEFLGDPARITR